MDALSDVLRVVRLSGAVFFDVKAYEPWAAESPPGAAIVEAVFPGSEHLIPYHVVTAGTCWGGLVGERPIQLAAGDILVFPHGDAHVMSSAPGMRAVPDPSVYRGVQEGRRPFAITVGERSNHAARIVCGFLACDARPFNPLLSALPRVLRVSRRDVGALSLFVQAAVAESTEPRIGSECVLGRLSELMFVAVVRRYVETLPAGGSGWLAGLRDPFVGRALEALHRRPAHDWTLDVLAREVGLSRSVLAQRFTQLLGQPPMQYLTRWRMQLAAGYLQSDLDAVAGVAARVGYESEAAFSRAFKKVVGMPPGEWRRRRSRSDPSAALLGDAVGVA